MKKLKLVTSTMCLVCPTMHQPGKDGGGKGLCPRCYKRRSRGLPDDPNPPKHEGPSVRVQTFVPKAMADEIHLRAGEIGVSGWLRRLIEQNITMPKEG